MAISDYEAFINPRRGIPPWAEKTVDGLSWALPVFAALASVGSGFEALRGWEICAAMLGIAGGILGALGVVFTNWSSRIRDRRLAEVRSLAALGVDMAGDAQTLSVF